MSISTEISRLQQARNKIRTKLIELGLASGTDSLDVLSENIEDIVNQGAVSAQVKEGETYTIPQGYHNGGGTVAGISGGGNYTLQERTVTPTKKQISVVSDDGYYGLSGVLVQPIPDAYQDVTSVNAGAGDVLTGKTIVSASGAVVAGTMPNIGAVSGSIDGLTTIEYSVPLGYHNGQGKVRLTGDIEQALSEI